MQAFSKEAADLLLEIGIIKQIPDLSKLAERASCSELVIARTLQSRSVRRRDRSVAPASLSRERTPRGRMKPLAPSRPPQGHARLSFFVLFFAGWALRDARRLRVEDLPRRSAHHGARTAGCCSTKHGFLFDIGMTIWRVVGGFVLAALVAVPLGIADGRLQADRGVLRAVRLVRALPAGLGLHSAADPVGRHRRDAEAAGDLHRLGVPDRADGRRHGRQRAARPGRGRATRSARATAASSRACCSRRAAPEHRRDPAARARLGLDLRDRRRADRLVVRHRPHDHRQPGAARHRPDHLRHHRHRRDRAGLRLPVQGARTARCFPGALREQARASRTSSRIFPAVRGGQPTRALEPTTLAVGDNDFVTILGPVGLRQVDAAAHRRRARHADRRAACCSTASR